MPVTPAPREKRAPATKPAPRTAAAKQAAPPPPPAKPDYLTKQQIDWLLQGIEPYRVKHKNGQSNLQSYDVRNHLNEVFGFANWDGEVIAMDLIFDVPKQLASGKPGAYVCYRATYRLTIRALSGKQLAVYTEVAAGDGQMPANMRFEAHDFAMKTAESQALKRAAINLGNQYGLSLYQKGGNNLDSITRGTFAYPEDTTLAPLTEQIADEADPDASAEAAAAFEAAEAPQTPPPPRAAQPPTPEPATAQQAAPPPAQPQQNDMPVTTNPDLDIAGLQEALGWLSNEARAELMTRWKKTTLPPLARITTEEQLTEAWVLYDLVKPPPASQDPAPAPEARPDPVPTQAQVDASWGLTQQRQAQVAQAQRHFGINPDTPPPYGDEQGWQDNNEFYNEP